MPDGPLPPYQGMQSEMSTATAATTTMATVDGVGPYQLTMPPAIYTPMYMSSSPSAADPAHLPPLSSMTQPQPPINVSHLIPTIEKRDQLSIERCNGPATTSFTPPLGCGLNITDLGAACQSYEMSGGALLNAGYRASKDGLVAAVSGAASESSSLLGKMKADGSAV